VVTTVQRTSTTDVAGGVRLRQRLSTFFLKPPDPSRTGATRAAAGPGSVSARQTVEELEDTARFANDKERLVGLLAAPFAAAISLLVYGALVANDPAASLKDGIANSKHVPPSLYADLLAVLLVLSVAMLTTAWFRKRLFLGCAMALYGLAVFNLHYWGFGVPFVLFGAWLIVRAYRAQRDLRAATGAAGPSVARASRGGAAAPVMPSASKRYTPPSPSSSSRRRSGVVRGAGEPRGVR